MILIGDNRTSGGATSRLMMTSSHGAGIGGVTSSLSSSLSPRSVHMTENRPVTLGCVATGGYPPPALTLRVARRDVTADCSFKNGATLTGERGLRRIQYRTERWTTRYQPRAEDDDALLRCTAQVPGLEPHVETVKLHVQCEPLFSFYLSACTELRVRCEQLFNSHPFLCRT